MGLKMNNTFFYSLHFTQRFIFHLKAYVMKSLLKEAIKRVTPTGSEPQCIAPFNNYNAMIWVWFWLIYRWAAQISRVTCWLLRHVKSSWTVKQTWGVKYRSKLFSIFEAHEVTWFSSTPRPNDHRSKSLKQDLFFPVFFFFFLKRKLYLEKQKQK